MSYQRVGVILAGLAFVAIGITPASADTLTDALVSTYNSNPTLNAARAQLRVTDESVPQALVAWRPSITGTISEAPYSEKDGVVSKPSLTSFSITMTQALFRGFRTVNNVKQRELGVLAGRETLRNAEQNALLQAVDAYMSVVRDQAILGFTQQNLDFLAAQVKAADDRLRVGEGTRTDGALANAAQAAAVFTFNNSKSNLATSRANYEQVTGRKPKNLMAAPPLQRGLPTSPEAAMARAGKEHPAILAAKYTVDAADYAVKVAEGALLPTITLNGSLSRGAKSATQPFVYSNSAQVTANLSVPIFDSGAIASQVRQAKEDLERLRILVDVQIETYRASTATNVALVETSRAQLASAQAAIAANQLALEGVIEERNVGQRTTLDVLNSQASLLTARISYAQAERNLVVNSYTLLSAVGGLTAKGLGLKVKIYDPSEHYDAVRDKLFGLRTPDGR